MKQITIQCGLLILLLISTNKAFSSDKSQKILKDSSWSIGGEYALNFSQISLSNWATGGESSIAASGLIHFFANRKKRNYIWENELKLSYGIIKQGDAGLRKSNDAINLTSTYGQSAFKEWFFTASIDFDSQFSRGYKYPNDSTVVSSFLAPAYILATIGLDYKPNKDFSISFSPISTRTTIVSNDSLSASAAYGVKAGNKLRSEFVGTFKLFFRTNLMENVSFRTNLALLSDYLDQPQNMDVNWKVYLNMKINRYLSTSITTHLIYDDDILIKNKEGALAPRVQFKEIFGIGFSYKFQAD